MSLSGRSPGLNSLLNTESLSGGQPHVSAKLLSRMGQAMRDVAVEPPAQPGGPFHFDLPLAGLAPGEYFLEIGASSPAGEAKDLIGFRVTN